MWINENTLAFDLRDALRNGASFVGRRASLLPQTMADGSKGWAVLPVGVSKVDLRLHALSYPFDAATRFIRLEGAESVQSLLNSNTLSS